VYILAVVFIVGVITFILLKSGGVI